MPFNFFVSAIPLCLLFPVLVHAAVAQNRLHFSKQSYSWISFVCLASILHGVSSTFALKMLRAQVLYHHIPFLYLFDLPLMIF